MFASKSNSSYIALLLFSLFLRLKKTAFPTLLIFTVQLLIIVGWSICCKAEKIPDAGGLCDGNIATILPATPIYLCSGSTITLAASAGTGYSWSTGATTSAINVTTAATYTVTISYGNGCPSLTTSATVTATASRQPSIVFNE